MITKEQIQEYIKINFGFPTLAQKEYNGTHFIPLNGNKFTREQTEELIKNFDGYNYFECGRWFYRKTVSVINTGDGWQEMVYRMND